MQTAIQHFPVLIVAISLFSAITILVAGWLNKKTPPFISITTILAQIAISIGELKDYSVDQLPDIAQQYITYGIWINSIYVGISLVFLIICSILVYKAFRNLGKWGEEYSFLCLCLGCGIGTISMGTFFNKLHDLILVTTAPKVWFILELKNLIS